MSKERQAYTVHFNVLSERWYDFRLFSCNFIVGSESLEGQLVNSREPEITISLCMYLCMSFHQSSVNCLGVRCLDSVDSQWHAARPVCHLERVEHLNCVARHIYKPKGEFE